MPNENVFSNKRLLLVGTGGVKRLHVLQALRALGLAKVICLNDKPNWASPLVDQWIEADPVHPSAETLTRVQREAGHLDGVMTYDDYSIEVAAVLARQLNLPGLAPEAARAAKNKAEFRRICTERGLPAPLFVRVDPPARGFVLADAGLQFPVVVKPTHGAGSVLVRRANTPSELRTLLEGHALALATDSSAALWPDRSVLLEEYVEGPEVDIDLLIQNGELRYAAVTDNFAPLEPYFMELGGRMPSTLPAAAQAELVRVAFEVLTALGVREACVHFEARWTTRGAVPIEANLRLGGAEVFEFNRIGCGVNLVEGAVRIALGLQVDHVGIGIPVRCVKSLNFIPPVSGSIKAVRVEPGLESDPRFGELVLFRQAGDSVHIPPDGFDYLGWMIAQGSTADEAAAGLARLCSQIQFEVGEARFSIPPVESPP